jgi:hypothetical protein
LDGPCPHCRPEKPARQALTVAGYSAYNYSMVEEVIRGASARSDGASRPTCPSCSGPTIRYGKTAAGRQRYRCRGCRRTTTEAAPRSPMGAALLERRISHAVESAFSRSYLRILRCGPALGGVRRAGGWVGGTWWSA